MNTLAHVIVARVGIENTCILPMAGFQSNSTISMLTRSDREMFVLTWVVGHFVNMKFRCYFHSNPLRVNFFLSFQIASSNFMCHWWQTVCNTWLIEGLGLPRELVPSSKIYCSCCIARTINRDTAVVTIYDDTYPAVKMIFLRHGLLEEIFF